MKRLNEQLDAALPLQGPSFYKKRVPPFIYSNLREGFGKRAYQQEAFGRFVYYLEAYEGKPVKEPVQLLFHMATGSGKTVIMAGLMLYLYNRGYRHFLFFVNSSNIIEKTKDNFTNPYASKYLFADTITLGEKKVNIRVADNFESNNDDDLTLVFTTIQGLHARLNTPRENAVTYEDFMDKKTVLISDEAHHINAETKKGPALVKEEKENLLSWEATVNKLFRVNNGNLLLEFTATLDLSLPEIGKKYADKLLFDYPLKQFRRDGYSKEVNILQADLPLFERALLALLLSQYRKKVFEKNGLRIKPVVLFKSRTIRESGIFYTAFLQKIRRLDAGHLQAIRDQVLRMNNLSASLSADSGSRVVQKAFTFFEENNLHFENLALELKQDFAEEKCVVVNSKEESEQKQLAINTLEDEDNVYRAVFAVDKLNEGWDVLNLFDIVRLYDTRDARGGKPGRTTVSEAQLIGRGARYCPFKTEETLPVDRRKFDDDSENELRVCEELYYHSAYNNRYIQELNTALTEIGIKPALSKECRVKIKDSFKAMPFYQEGVVYLNERIKGNVATGSGLDSSVIDQCYKVGLQTGVVQSSAAFYPSSAAAEPEQKGRMKKTFRLPDLGLHVLRKALARLPFYQFSNLKKLLPGLSSMDAFMRSEIYLGAIKVELSGSKDQIENLTQQDKLQATITVLERLAPAIERKYLYQATKEFRPFLLKDLLKDKLVQFPVEEGEEKELGKSMLDPMASVFYLNLPQKEWFVLEDCFGTAAEKKFIHCIDEIYSLLKEKFDEVFLVKNERFVKLYDFESGRAIEPNFILFLLRKEASEDCSFQLFIEVGLQEQDSWKKNFFEQLQNESGREQEWQGKKFCTGGLFLREGEEAAFEKTLFSLTGKRESVSNL